ncbi:MAG: RnfABCDGE type electron transport complex subunit D [bacterium]|nr:RnfABCDGE type electron transport complex subunit D [bacterium]
MEKLIVSTSPHIRVEEDVGSIMRDVIFSLLPTTLIGVVIFGLHALYVVLTAVSVAILSEAIIQRLMKREITVRDGSAAITGLLLALNLPPSAPLWMTCIGAGLAIGLGKQVYGGLGYNPFNPALIARVILLVSFPVQMTTWTDPLFIDAKTGATPLGILKEQGIEAASQISLLSLFLGETSGCIGEVSAVALLVGAIYLLIKGHITWHIPISFIGTAGIFTLILWLFGITANPLFHILSGGLILGAFFMATDMVTSPITKKGKIIFGIGCGILTVIIRLWAGYPEGVSFSILIMNAFTPLIDRWRFTHPTKFGGK